jgi:ribosomal protein RSM22 (predicted rRNA methylase)
VLVLVEPGTAEGYRNVINARHLLLEQEAEASSDSVSVLAPCTHSRSCPMTTMTSTPDGSEAPLTLQRWCWFEQRLDRPKFLMQLKQASGSYEDHPFSYVIISRNNCYAGTTGNGNGNEHSFADARIIEPPTKRKRHVNVQLCTEEGLLISVLYLYLLFNYLII